MATNTSPGKLSNFWNGLSPLTRNIIVLGIFILIVIAIYLVYRKFKTVSQTKDSAAQIDSVSSDIKKLQDTGKKQTLSASEVNGIANDLFTAMDGYGTDYDSILRSIVKINNQIDLLAIIKSYGVRELSSGHLNPAPNLTGTLNQAFSDELSDAQVLAINNLLAKKGIVQRF